MPDQDHQDQNKGMRLEARPERILVRTARSRRHLDFVVTAPSEGGRHADIPIDLALVIDRSGSMGGDKIVTAREAASVVVQRLRDNDRVAVLAFDDVVEVVQEATVLDAQGRDLLQQRLRRIDARGSTALHEGWLRGCQAIASRTSATNSGISRTFLLTDGQANQGLCDPRLLAKGAAEVRTQTGITTSTFGIGAGYAEGLLTAMAEAGGGQFHHLRTSSEIVDTFVGEMEDMKRLAVRDVRLEVVAAEDVGLELLSTYWNDMDNASSWRLQVALGPMLDSESRHVVVKARFPEGQPPHAWSVRARLVWQGDDGEHVGDWVETSFRYASDADCDGEPHDPDVVVLVAQNKVDRLRRLVADVAYDPSRAQAVREEIDRAGRRFDRYLRHSPGVRVFADELRALRDELERGVDSMSAKEHYHSSSSRSRGKKDYRGSRDWQSS